MRKLLNTLYVTTPDAYLARDGLNVVVKAGDEERFRIPIHNIEGIVTFGYTGASPALIALCAENGVSLSMHSEHGKFLARMSGKTKGNVILRRQQFRMADNLASKLTLSRIFIAAKIFNCRNVIQRAIRDHGNENTTPILQNVSNILENRQRQALRAESFDKLRGIEGDSAMEYFGTFNELIITQKSEFRMNGRTRRPPLDPVNAMLSFAYTLLANEVQSALECVGLDPYVGFLHTDRPGRTSLALDIMEELRPYLADRLVLTLINRKQVNVGGFKIQSGMGVHMSDDTRKELISGWQKRKSDTIFHPFLEENIPIGLLPHAQALLLARYIRGDLDMYPSFLMK